MELSATGRRSDDFAPIAAKLDAKERGKCQLSSALLFSSIRALSAKRTIELSHIFAPIPGGGHATSRVELFIPPVLPS